MQQSPGGDNSDTEPVAPQESGNGEPAQRSDDNGEVGAGDTSLDSDMEPDHGNAIPSREPVVNLDEPQNEIAAEVRADEGGLSGDRNPTSSDAGGSNSGVRNAEAGEAGDIGAGESRNAATPHGEASAPDEGSDGDQGADEPAGEADAMPTDCEQSGPTELEELAETLDDVRKRVAELVRLGERNADHVAALHAENQRLRNGELRTALNVMVRDVIRVYDDVVRLTALDGEEPDGHLSIVARLLIDMLSRWDVEVYSPEVGDLFDTALHSGVVRIATTEPISNSIAGVRRCGFRIDGKVLRTADVEVYRQEQPADSPESDPTTTAEVST